MARRLRAHDLVPVAATQAFAQAPAWVAPALARAPFVVVRRAAARLGGAAVGVRGAARGQRFGTWLELGAAAYGIAPEQLARQAPAAARAGLGAFVLLAEIAPLCDACGLAWGPTGSVGFELASGVPSVTPDSDLDLLIRAPEPLAPTPAADLLADLSTSARRAGVRIDVQIETPHGAFLLADRFAAAAGHPRGAAAGGKVLLRTPAGPRLVDDPWRP